MANVRTAASPPAHVFQKDGLQVEVMGRSVFERLGFSAAETRELASKAVDEVLARRNNIKAQLVGVLEGELRAQGLTVTQMATIASVSRPRLSNILNRNYEKFSIDAVVDLMQKFGKEVRFKVVSARAMPATSANSTRTSRAQG